MKLISFAKIQNKFRLRKTKTTYSNTFFGKASEKREEIKKKTRKTKRNGKDRNKEKFSQGLAALKTGGHAKGEARDYAQHTWHY